MPKNIVICCDGTGNEYGDCNSNVVLLYQTLIQDDLCQACYYHPGVGTEGSPSAHNKLEAFFDVVAGLGFGSGLLSYVGDAYRFLMDVYEEGDRIYLFGFSRGAYTVRALSGMLHMYGLLHRGNDGLIAYILKMFARRTRKASGMQDSFKVAAGFQATYSRKVLVHLVGVWDTVSSVGMVWDPLQLPYTACNPIMQNGRHAVSIDERRSFFRNNLWGAPDPHQSIKQVWLTGVHSDIGGSYPSLQAGLSQITLQWVLREPSLGLLVDPHRAASVLGRIPPAPPSLPIQPSASTSPCGASGGCLEVLPHRYYNPTTAQKYWTIPLGPAG